VNLRAVEGACGTGRLATLVRSPPGSGRSTRRKDHSAFNILHSALSLAQPVPFRALQEGVSALSGAHSIRRDHDILRQLTGGLTRCVTGDVGLEIRGRQPPQ